MFGCSDARRAEEDVYTMQVSRESVHKRGNQNVQQVITYNFLTLSLLNDKNKKNAQKTQLKCSKGVVVVRRVPLRLRDISSFDVPPFTQAARQLGTT